MWVRALSTFRLPSAAFFFFFLFFVAFSLRVVDPRELIGEVSILPRFSGSAPTQSQITRDEFHREVQQKQCGSQRAHGAAIPHHYGEDTGLVREPLVKQESPSQEEADGETHSSGGANGATGESVRERAQRLAYGFGVDAYEERCTELLDQDRHKANLKAQRIERRTQYRDVGFLRVCVFWVPL
jgi:hypothetical protein